MRVTLRSSRLRSGSSTERFLDSEDDRPKPAGANVLAPSSLIREALSLLGLLNATSGRDLATMRAVNTVDATNGPEIQRRLGAANHRAGGVSSPAHVAEAGEAGDVAGAADEDGSLGTLRRRSISQHCPR